MTPVKLWFSQHFETWMGETLVVAIILGLVAYFTGNSVVQWIQALAVLFTFGYVSVTDRLLEDVSQQSNTTVKCYKMAMRYFVAKEFLWTVAFILIKAYPALIGNAIFLLHPLWRRWWRRRYPKHISSS